MGLGFRVLKQISILGSMDQNMGLRIKVLESMD
jgi:hypothetical protein